MGAKNATLKIRETTFDRTIFAGKSSKKLYKIGSKLLGSGAFGKVYRGKSVLNPDLHVAIKSFKKKDLHPDDIKAIEGEIKNLRSLDHPNIIKYFDTVEDSKHIFIVTEFCYGKTLAAYLSENDNYLPEEETAYIMEQLLSAITHCHSKKISHRDLKPDNIMIDKCSNITLIDFGLSRLMIKEKSMRSQAGCPFFMAPEVFRENYTSKCDIWSLGIIFYIMLTGHIPFEGDDLDQVISNILQSEIQGKNSLNFAELKLNKNLSAEGIDLVKKMLTPNPKLRISAKDALAHNWFSILKGEETAHEIENVNLKVLESLRTFKCESFFKKATLNFLVKMIPDDEYHELRLEFRKIDEDCDGMLSFTELRHAFNVLSKKVSDKEINNIITKLDFQKNGKVNYTEFLVATIDRDALKKDKLIQDLFKHFDRNDSGCIEQEDIINELHTVGMKISKSELKEIMRHHDKKERGFIDYEEFDKMIRSS